MVPKPVAILAAVAFGLFLGPALAVYVTVRLVQEASSGYPRKRGTNSHP